MVRNVSIKNLAAVAAARANRPAVLRPHKVGDKWHKPKWSAMAIARERKRRIQNGEEWSWDIPHKEVVKRIPFKGHLQDLRRVEREAEIKRCMARMPSLIREYKKKKPRKNQEGMGIFDIISLPRGTPMDKAFRRKL